MKIEAFFDTNTYTLTYVVFDENSKDAVIIDPVLDYEPGGSSYSYESMNKVLDFVKSKNLKIHTIMETHAHADHLSSSQELKKHLPDAKIAIGKEITEVQNVFKGFFNLDDSFKTDGSQFDILLEENKEHHAGSLTFTPIHTPGHTPACYSYLIEDAVFTGDALFMPDFGVARCDFPGGSADTLYHSVHEKLYHLPDETRVFTGHDYQPGGRELRYESTIGESKQTNIQLKENTKKEDFVELRTGRDKTLAAPRLLLPSVQVNANGGILPPVEDNGTSYLKIPIREKK
ncbi:MAG: MBL fold metallo-hydrolase [Bdellovibrionaceae bacterium]|nr:MBL fold metallo-hydrolase [Pseudobdellovibrionaceae bacterium]